MTDGRYLADRITEKQMKDIKNEKFDDFRKDDYWILNGHKWTVLGVSTLERKKGEFTPHMVIVPKKEVNVLND